MWNRVTISEGLFGRPGWTISGGDVVAAIIDRSAYDPTWLNLVRIGAGDCGESLADFVGERVGGGDDLRSCADGHAAVAA